MSEIDYKAERLIFTIYLILYKKQKAVAAIVKMFHGMLGIMYISVNSNCERWNYFLF